MSYRADTKGNLGSPYPLEISGWMISESEQWVEPVHTTQRLW